MWKNKIKIHNNIRLVSNMILIGSIFKNIFACNKFFNFSVLPLFHQCFFLGKGCSWNLKFVCWSSRNPFQKSLQSIEKRKLLLCLLLHWIFSLCSHYNHICYNVCNLTVQDIVFDLSSRILCIVFMHGKISNSNPLLVPM